MIRIIWALYQPHASTLDAQLMRGHYMPAARSRCYGRTLRACRLRRARLLHCMPVQPFTAGQTPQLR